MNACDTYQPLLTDALFGGSLAPEQRARLEEHLSECPACARALREMRQTLAVMGERERPAPPPGFWDAFQERLDERLDEHEARNATAGTPARSATTTTAREPDAGLRGRLGAAVRRLTQSAPAWARYGGVALGALLAGLLLGRVAFGPAPGPAPTAPGATQQRAADPPSQATRRARLHLARSKVLLIELAAFDPATGDLRALRLPEKRKRARSLTTDSEQIRAALEETDRRERLRDLVDELRDVLRQIAVLKQARGDVEAVQARIEDADLILRINLEELRLTSTLPPPGHTAAAR